MWIEANPNPCGKFVGDCVVRAISILLDQSWEQTFLELCVKAFFECDMPSANHVWGGYLEEKGYVCESIRSNNVRTIAPSIEGRCILATGEHVVAVINGNYYDAWDSGDEYPIFCWRRG